MKRIILRHLSGSKTNEVKEYPLNHFQELTIGRDPSSTIHYDPDRDDLVGRQHAKIVVDSPDLNQFTITDLDSRNGTYVNKKRIVGSVKIAPGDVVQFGPSGPEFQFDLEPRLENLVRPTRVALNTTAPTLTSSGVKATRESSTARSQSTAASPGQPAIASASATRPSIGKATVERLIFQTKSESRKHMIAGATALLVVIAMIAGYAIYQNKATRAEHLAQINKQEADARRAQELAAVKKQEEEANRPLTGDQIFAAGMEGVVLIEAGWYIMYTLTQTQIHHQFVDIAVEGEPSNYVPRYIRYPDGTIEPYLVTEKTTKEDKPISGDGSGTGFIVDSTGSILTNRHVAAAWETSYDWPQYASRAGLIDVMAEDGEGGMVLRRKERFDPSNLPKNWIPSKPRQLGGKPIKGKIVEGKHSYLDVTLAKTSTRIPASKAQYSDRHDVARITIGPGFALHPVTLDDKAYDRVKVGHSVYVLGYPGVSPDVVSATFSNDVFNRGVEARTVANPTLSRGEIGNLLRGQNFPSGDKDFVYSRMGDLYQLTINSTGPGNSGGPVFDERGRVIAIFSAIKTSGNVTVTLAIPIKFGMELLGMNPVIE